MLIRFFKKEYFISDKPVLITYCLLFVSTFLWFILCGTFYVLVGYVLFVLSFFLQSMSKYKWTYIIFMSISGVSSYYAVCLPLNIKDITGNMIVWDKEGNRIEHYITVSGGSEILYKGEYGRFLENIFWEGEGTLYLKDTKRVSFKTRTNKWGSKMEEFYKPVYIGQLKNSQANGKGLYYWYSSIQPDKIIQYYEGDFVNDRKEGKGTVYLIHYSSIHEIPDTTIYYTGDWVDDKYHGKGVLVDGLKRYEGDFINGEKHGYGIEYEMGKLSYEGEFANGKRNGRGTLYFEGEVFKKGIFVDGYIKETTYKSKDLKPAGYNK